MAVNQNHSIIEDGVIPTFSIEPIRNAFRSDSTGQDEYDNVEMVHIRVLGDNKTEVYEPVNRDHIRRFPMSYRNFKEGTQMQGGTPVESFNDLDPATIAKMKSVNVYTIEQLASLSDGSVTSIGNNGRELRERAQKFLEARNGDKLTETLSEQQKMIQDLKAQIEAMQSAGAKQSADEPVKQVGRPRKLPPHMDESNS